MVLKNLAPSTSTLAPSSPPPLPRAALTPYQPDLDLQTGTPDGFTARVTRMRTFCKAKEKREEKACQLSNGKCEKGPKAHEKYRQLHVDARHRVLYCYIPKAGCTNWHQKLVEMSARPQVVRPWQDVNTENTLKQFAIYPLTSFPPGQQLTILKTYFKFVFVRHPMTRLLSAYLDKFAANNGHGMYAQRMGGAIAAYTRGATPPEGQGGGANSTQTTPTTPATPTIPTTPPDTYNVTFREFFKYITEVDSPLSDNIHWLEFDRLCHPCTIDYDFIGRQEFFSEEAQYLIRTQFKEPESAHFESAAHATNTSFVKARKYYGDFTVAEEHALFKRYGDDMKMFGYSWADIMG